MFKSIINKVDEKLPRHAKSLALVKWIDLSLPSTNKTMNQKQTFCHKSDWFYLCSHHLEKKTPPLGKSFAFQKEPLPGMSWFHYLHTWAAFLRTDTFIPQLAVMPIATMNHNKMDRLSARSVSAINSPVKLTMEWNRITARVLRPVLL